MNQNLHAKKRNEPLSHSIPNHLPFIIYIYSSSWAEPSVKGDSRKFKLAPVEKVKKAV